MYVHALKDKKDERARERIDSIFFFEEDNPGETRVFRDPGNSITILFKYEENMKGDCGLKHLSDETMIAGRYTETDNKICCSLIRSTITLHLTSLPYYHGMNARLFRKDGTIATGVQVVENARNLDDLIDAITCTYYA